jgi:predicted nucleic acid-binding Zn ribbon protein
MSGGESPHSSDPAWQALEARRRRLAEALHRQRTRLRRVPTGETGGERERLVLRSSRVEPEALGTGLKRELKRSGLSWMMKHRELLLVWNEVIGPELGEKTRVTRWRDGVLTVEVDSAPLLQELDGFYKESLLESLRAAAPDLAWRDLRFRLAGGRSRPKRGAR